MSETTSAESLDLLNRFLAARDSATREELVLRHVPLVHYVLGRLGFSQEMGSDYEDLVSQGLLGLIESVDRYNPSFGTQFRTYALVRVRGKILDYLRTLDWLSRTQRSRSRAVQKTIADFWITNQRAPSDQEISDRLNLPVDQVQKALVDSSHVIVSLDETREVDEEDQSLHELVADENQPNPSDVLYEEETMTQMMQALRDLDKREQLVLSLYYHEKLTFKEIGEVLEITESRVCQLHARAITTLRVNMQSRENPLPTPKSGTPVAARKVQNEYGSHKNGPVVDRRG
jgi:RNA polymerase sigma factor for flagellar operon FliA